MYRQIRIHPLDEKYQKILWRENPLNPVQEFRLQTVTYGTASAPFLALRALRQLVIDDGDAFPQAKVILLESAYVFGGDTISETLEKRNQLIKLLSGGGFPLSKWSANNKRLLAGLSASDTPNMDKEFSEDHAVHVLGVQWNPLHDHFYYTITEPPMSVPTKRLVLSHISKLFDPLGWLAPVVILAKIFIQKLWMLKCFLDEPLPAALESEWNTFQSQLSCLQGIRIPRWVGTNANSGAIQLHGFCDASSKAYAAVVYLRREGCDNAFLSLLMAKSRVAPLKTLTIPRLELCSTVLLARLLHFVMQQMPIKCTSYVCWSDSMVTLEWLKHSPARWKIFVAHRVAEIQTILPQAIWRHIPSHHNPADCASRGLTPEEFVLFDKWWSASAWLSGPSSSWPSITIVTPPSELLEESKAFLIHHGHIAEPWNLHKQFSSWFKSIRVTAHIYRIFYPVKITPSSRMRSNENRGQRDLMKLPALTVLELKRAENFWLKWLQWELFPSEITMVQNGEQINSPLATLAPFLDADGLLRIRGRLVHSFLKPAEKQPVLIKSHPLTFKLIYDIHVKQLYVGPIGLLAEIRKRFWLLRSRQVIRAVIHSCVVCARHRAQMEQQLMGDLPEFRVNPSARAFLHVGIDYAGPIPVRTSSGRGYKSTKAYIALFVCMVTKAIHIEVSSDYSTAAFIAALQRFVARRGVPTDIYSDNGTNFVGADRELTSAFNATVNDVNMQTRCAEQGTTWHFIPPAAPHFGGLWEVSIRTVKRYLVRTIGSYTLTYEELTTVLCRIEACMNSRPLTSLSDSPDDYTVLTPGHFLIGDPLTSLPESSVLELREQRLSRWQLLQRLTDQFWEKWSTDYLHILQQRSKWLKPNIEIRSGRIILVATAGLPPDRWMLGRIIKCHPGDDGLVRVVTVQTSTSQLKRPITKLSLLPIDVPRDGDSDI